MATVLQQLAAAGRQHATVERLEQLTQVMATVLQQLAAAGRQHATVERLEQLTQVLATKPPASLARLPMATVADLIMRIVLMAALAIPTRTLKTAIVEAPKAETQEATPMTAAATVTMGAMAMTTTVTTVHQAAVTESRADTPVATAGMAPEIAAVKTMMTMTTMMLVALAQHSTWPLSTTWYATRRLHLKRELIMEASKPTWLPLYHSPAQKTPARLRTPATFKNPPQAAGKKTKHTPNPH
jgi:hypothetical protein